MTEIINDESEKQKNKNRSEKECDVKYSESVRNKWFCCVFKLGFL